MCSARSMDEPVAALAKTDHQTRWRLALAALRRGRSTQEASSSRARSRTLPGAPGCPSGMGRPVETRAAMSQMRKDLPSPCLPATSDGMPRGMTPGQSHTIWRSGVSEQI